MKDSTEQNADRKAWMGLIAKAPAGRVATLLDDAMARPGFTWLRRPEQGSVMVQGRMGATGAPFNLGEMTVTRCALTLTTGEAGHAYIQGRSKEDAEACAMVDALMQTGAASLVKKNVIDPIQAEISRTRTDRQAKAAATKVDFFTMVRGEDQ